LIRNIANDPVLDTILGLQLLNGVQRTRKEISDLQSEYSELPNITTVYVQQHETDRQLKTN
jgi:hypothetical protein